MTDDPVIAVPAELELEERLVGPVTFRMAAWLALAAAGIVLIALGPGTALPVVTGVPMVLVGVVGSFWRPGGRAVTSWIAPLWSYRRRIKSANRASDEKDNTAKPKRRRRPLRNRIVDGRLWATAVRRVRTPHRAGSRPRPSSPMDRRRLAGAAMAGAALAAAVMAAFVVGRVMRQHDAPNGAVPTKATPAPAVPSPAAPLGPQPVLEPWWSDCDC